MIRRGDSAVLADGVATVLVAPTAVGQVFVAGQPVLRLSSGGAALTATIDPVLAMTLQTGMTGVATDPVTGTSLTVEVAAQVDPLPAPAVEDSAPDAVEGDAPPEAASEGNVLLAFVPVVDDAASLASTYDVSITVATTPEPVLAVPTAAVVDQPDGGYGVRVLDPGATAPRTATVTVGLSGDGLVEVTPESGSLREGDRVLVSTGDDGG